VTEQQSAEELDRRIHNIRGPLNTISMNAELGKLRIDNGDPPEKILKALNTIVLQCTACADELEALRSYLLRESGA
jgi:signal transduction histidine kinase